MRSGTRAGTSRTQTPYISGCIPVAFRFLSACVPGNISDCVIGQVCFQALIPYISGKNPGTDANSVHFKCLFRTNPVNLFLIPSVSGCKRTVFPENPHSPPSLKLQTLYILGFSCGVASTKHPDSAFIAMQIECLSRNFRTDMVLI